MSNDDQEHRQLAGQTEMDTKNAPLSNKTEAAKDFRDGGWAWMTVVGL